MVGVIVWTLALSLFVNVAGSYSNPGVGTILTLIWVIPAPMLVGFLVIHFESNSARLSETWLAGSA